MFSLTLTIPVEIKLLCTFYFKPQLIIMNNAIYYNLKSFYTIFSFLLHYNI